MTTVEEESSSIETKRVGTEAVFDIENFKSHGMRFSVMGPTYHALNELW